MEEDTRRELNAHRGKEKNKYCVFAYIYMREEYRKDGVAEPILGQQGDTDIENSLWMEGGKKRGTNG